MEEHIREIALRLKGLREVLEISVAEIASVCGINDDEYQELESGEHDIPIGILHRICHNYNVELSAMLFGDEPRMSSYYLTRKGHGPSVERSQHYKYQSLAAGFANRKPEWSLKVLRICSSGLLNVWLKQSAIMALVWISGQKDFSTS